MALKIRYTAQAVAMAFTEVMPQCTRFPTSAPAATPRMEPQFTLRATVVPAL